MPVRPLALLCLLGSLAACNSTVTEDDVASAIRHGRYGEAVHLAEERLSEDPADETLQRELTQAQVALILDRARRSLFAGHAEDALAMFYRALDMDPQNPAAATWIRKTRNQLAERWLDHAQGITGGENLDEAEMAFEKVLAYVLPIGGEDDPALWIESQAKAGLSRVLLRKNYRHGQSQTYFQTGVSALRDHFLFRAENNLRKAVKFGAGDEAEDRRSRVGGLLASDRLAMARELESVGLFFAARNEYRLVLLLEPENEAAKNGLDRMDRETRSERSMSKAEMSLLRGELDVAMEALEDARLLSDAQGDRISLLTTKVEDARLNALYEKGLFLERDYRYPEAVAAFDELLTQAEFYKDTIARRKALQSLIDDAQVLWAKAEDAESEEESYNYYWEIQHVVWPEYRDVEERLAVLHAKGYGDQTDELSNAPEQKEWTPKWSGGRRSGGARTQRQSAEQPRRGGDARRQD